MPMLPIDPATIRIGLDFLRRLPGFLRNPVRGDEALQILSGRLSHRETLFLTKVRQTVFQNTNSPYRSLLKGIACEYGELERLVSREGVEGALGELLRAGVYLTVDEFKGRKPVKRGSTSFTITPEILRNPLASFHVAVRSGGSRSSGTPVLLDLGFVRACAVNSRLVFEARRGLGWAKAIWEVPGAGARFRLLKYCAQGAPPEKWFSQVHPKKAEIAPSFSWSERLMRWASSGAGIHMPRPIYAPINDPLPIVTWFRETLRKKRIPHLFTFPSSAVRLCRAAAEAGLSLTGVQFLLGGEPITEARAETIRRSGAGALPRYGSMECGPIGYGCLNPENSDDMHFQQDLHAIVQAGTEAARLGVPPDALFVTALNPLSPFVLLNVSMGDTAKVVQRRCGCPLEHLGWERHLHTVRSYEKLTGEGVTFHDTDVIQVLETVLPRRFGGSPIDYQLIEGEDREGHPLLSLLVHPRVGTLPAEEVVETFLAALGSSSAVSGLMESVWRESSLLKLERREPIATQSGKILHLHLDKGGKAPSHRLRSTPNRS